MKSSILYESKIFNEYRRLSDLGYVLSHESAMEVYGLFSGFINPTCIHAYGEWDCSITIPQTLIIHGCVTDHLSIDVINNIRVTSIDKTINDMIKDISHMDYGILLESFSNYYHMNEESLESFHIYPENVDLFHSIVTDVIEF